MNIKNTLKKILRIDEYALPERGLEELKQITKIIFIDDRKFEVPQILKNSGWINTKLVKDIDSLDSPDISEAHIIFIDIGGVGEKLQFRDEGLGLISALRKKYPNKKLVLYSAERTGDRFHDGLSAADIRLPKNADPFQFQAVVEKLSKESFSLSECVARLEKILKNEFGLYLSEKEIIAHLKHLGKKNDFSISMVGKVFNISNAGSIASIISLFLRPE